MTNFRTIAAILTFGIAAAACSDAAAAPATEITVYATPTCGCCGAWMDHMRENGFTVEVVYQDDLTAIRREHGLPPELVSCHMGVVEGFAIEGHVPANVVKRLIAEKPAVLGLAAPGMPAGSPGMEMPGVAAQPFDVLSYDENGPVGVFQHVN